MIYGLDQHSQGVLHAVIVQSMAAHGILPIEDKKEVSIEEYDDNEEINDEDEFEDDYEEEDDDEEEEEEEEDYIDEERSSMYEDEDYEPSPPSDPYPY